MSGRRLWGWARDRYGDAPAFFADWFVLNYCPLVFLEASGRNFTPDKLPAAEASPLYAACDDMLRAVVAQMQPRMVIGVGGFAEERARAALPDMRVERVLHPSPASPLANKDWAGQCEKTLRALNLVQSDDGRALS